MTEATNKESRRDFMKTTGTAAGAATAVAAFGTVGEAHAHTVEINAQLPTAEQQQALLALPGDGPVVMLNLLKFKPGGGQAEYMKYAMGVQPLLAKAGAKTLFFGSADLCVIGNADWDMVALVQYPNKMALGKMTATPEYQAIHEHRLDGLEGQVLYAMTQQGGADSTA